MKPNLINMYPRVARAVQIAIAGRHTLAIDGEAAQTLVKVIQKEGGAGRIHAEGLTFHSPQMFVTAELPPDHSAQELVKQLYDNNDNPFDKWSDDAEILQHRFTSVGVKLSPGGAAMFDTAVDKHNATLQEQINCIEVARTIQGLDMIETAETKKGNINIDVINVECLAEALQYTILNVPRKELTGNSGGER